MAAIPKKIPANHPLRQLLGKLTMMSLESVGIKDQEVFLYISDLLTDFAHVDNLYKLKDERGKRLEYIVDMLLEAECYDLPKERDIRKHIGDYCLFIAGLFPESISRGGRRPLGPKYYIDHGKESYLIVSMFDISRPTAAFFRKLSDLFEGCISALNIEKHYLRDPFYQYLIRQMGY